MGNLQPKTWHTSTVSHCHFVLRARDVSFARAEQQQYLETMQIIDLHSRCALITIAVPFWRISYTRPNTFGREALVMHCQQQGSRARIGMLSCRICIRLYTPAGRLYVRNSVCFCHRLGLHATSGWPELSIGWFS
eukprot:178030-Chlamydomonas_euryale.AAC.9